MTTPVTPHQLRLLPEGTLVRLNAKDSPLSGLYAKKRRPPNEPVGEVLLAMLYDPEVVLRWSKIDRRVTSMERLN